MAGHQPRSDRLHPAGWAHRSVNVGDEPYRFLAVYPGSAGHDYGWVLTHGMGLRARRSADRVELVPFGTPAGTAGPTARSH